MFTRILIGASIFASLAMGQALAQPVGRICDPCDPADLRKDMVVNSYWYAFGRRPGDAESRFWMSQPAHDPRLANTEMLVSAHLSWLRTAPSEQWETARRALREALRDVAGIDREPVIKNAVVDMMAGREGGGYRGLLAYLRKPDVRQYYVNLAQVTTQPVAQPVPPTRAQPQVQAPRNMEDVGKLSLHLSSGEIQKMISLTVAQQITTSNPLIGNAGAGLVGNTGAALTQVTPLTSTIPLANVTPFTMPIGNNFTMPIGNNFQAQSIASQSHMVTEAFQMAFGRNPSPEELRTWVEFRQKYPKSTVASSAGNLAETLRYVLALPAGEVQRKGMAQTAVLVVFRRAPTPNELATWSERIRRERMLFTDLVPTMRREAASQPSPPQRGRGRASRAVGG